MPYQEHPKQCKISLECQENYMMILQQFVKDREKKIEKVIDSEEIVDEIVDELGVKVCPIPTRKNQQKYPLEDCLEFIEIHYSLEQCTVDTLIHFKMNYYYYFLQLSYKENIVKNYISYT